MFNHPRLRALFSLLMLTIVVIVMNLNIQTDKISKDVNLLAQIVNPYSPSQPAGGNGQSNDSDTASEPKYYCHEYPGNKKYDGMTSHPNPSIDAQIGNQGVRPEIIDNQPGWGISWKAQHDPIRVLQGGGMIASADQGLNYGSASQFLKNQINQAIANCPNPDFKGVRVGNDWRTTVESAKSGYYTYKGKTYKFTDLAIKNDFGANCYLPPSLPTEARPVHTGPGGTTGGGPGGTTPKFPPQGGTTGGGKSTPPVNNTGNNPEGGNNQNPNNSSNNSRGLVFDHSFIFETKCNLANKIDYQPITSKRKLGDVLVDSIGFSSPSDPSNSNAYGTSGWPKVAQSFIISLPSSFAGNPIDWSDVWIREGIGGSATRRRLSAGFLP